jgi:hypothetical protein
MTQGKDKQQPPPPLDKVVEENKQVVEDIRHAADELAVAHAVLATELGKANPSEDTREAVQRTKDVKSTLKETAEKLEETTDVLEQHVSKSLQKP